MPGYVRGFVEREFADRWEFVCRVDPFTGSQGAFKYVFLGTRWASALEPVVHTEGIPDDLAPATKLVMMGRTAEAMDRLSNEDLHERFQSYAGSDSDVGHPRHVTLEELQSFDWEQTISEERWQDLAERTDEPRRELRLFELVDTDGTEYDEWAPDGADGWRLRVGGTDDAAALLDREWIEFDGRTVALRPRSRRELLPDSWFDLLELLAHDYHQSYQDVRLTFYWHH